jgi:hypothetical protein
MKEITGDDYPTYEDSVNMTLAEREKDSVHCYLNEVEQKITKERPSLNKDGSTYADEAWHNVTNIEIACDLNDDDPLYWGSKVMAKAKEAGFYKLNTE